MRRHDIQRSTMSLTAAVLVVALVIMVNWLGARHWRRADWTASNLYTLSEKSLNIVNDLEQPVRIIVFMTPTSSLWPQVHELLNRYDAASGQIEVDYIDPDREPLKTQKLAEEFGISVANTVVFTSGDRSKYVTSDQMAEFDYSGLQYGAQPRLKAFKAEEEFTAAILSLVAPSVPKVYFVTGHGEPGLSPGATPSDRSLSTLTELLKRENMETAETSLLSGHVPEDADVLAIVGPMRSLTENEISAVRTFLEGGGRLLAALDPLIEPDGTMRTIRLEDLLIDWDVVVRDDLVIDPTKKLPFYDLSAVYLDAYGDHPVTQGMEGLAVLFLIARSVGGVSEPVGTVTNLIETSDQGWGETDLAQLLRGDPVDAGADDTPGPVSVAVAVERTNAGEEAGKENDQPTDEAAARLIVLGDSDFLSDSEIANAGNAVLAVNAFNWLASQEQALGIPPREIQQSGLYLDASQLRMILVIVLLIMPGAAILAGIFVWRRRRH